MNAIFYTLHYEDEFVRDTFKKLQKLNPQWDIHSIGFKGNKLLPGSLIAKKDKYPSNSCIEGALPVEWSEADLLFCEAYRHKPKYDYYFFVEYDTIFNVPVLDFFDIEGEDFLGCNVDNNPGQAWVWIQKFESFIDQHRDVSMYDDDYGAGGQTTCVSFNNSTLKNYRNEIIKNKYFYEHMFSELRLGTVLKKYTTLKNIRSDISDYVSWTTDDITYNFKKPYFYHPGGNRCVNSKQMSKDEYYERTAKCLDSGIDVPWTKEVEKVEKSASFAKDEIYDFTRFRPL